MLDFAALCESLARATRSSASPHDALLASLQRHQFHHPCWSALFDDVAALQSCDSSLATARESVEPRSNDAQCLSLLESAMAGGLGFDLTTDAEIRPDAFLFGEAQGRIVVSVCPEDEERFLDIMMRNGVEFDLLGHVTKGSVRVDDEEWGTVASFRDRYDNALNFSKKS